MAEEATTHDVHLHEDTDASSDVRWTWHCSCGAKDDVAREKMHAEAEADLHAGSR